MRPADGLQADPETAAALQAVLRRPERFKRLTVVCHNDHVLARVYKTAVGHVLVHQTGGVKKTRATDLPGYGTVQLPPIRGPRAEVTAYVIDDDVDRLWPMQCRCTRAQPRVWELLDAIEAGKKRLRVSNGG